MNTLQTQYLLGSQHSKPGSRSITSLEGIVIVNSAVYNKYPQSKQPNNEDSCGIALLSDRTKIAMVADSHHGYMAGEIAVQMFPELLTTFDRNALVQSGAALDRYIMKKATDGSSTTFTALIHTPTERTIINIGDAYCLNANKIYRSNFAYFLGQGQSDIEHFIQIAKCSGPLFLCSDGINPEDQRTKELLSRIDYSNPLRSAETIMKESPALQPRKDNIAFAIVP